MAECPDCFSGSWVPGVERGDGKCKTCMGSGRGNMIDEAIANIVSEHSECHVCEGSGECQTCGGTGEID